MCPPLRGGWGRVVTPAGECLDVLSEIDPTTPQRARLFDRVRRLYSGKIRSPPSWTSAGFLRAVIRLHRLEVVNPAGDDDRGPAATHMHRCWVGLQTGEIVEADRMKMSAESGAALSYGAVVTRGRRGFLNGRNVVPARLNASSVTAVASRRLAFGFIKMNATPVPQPFGFLTRNAWAVIASLGGRSTGLAGRRLF
jgi:hypothetical protein